MKKAKKIVCMILSGILCAAAIGGCSSQKANQTTPAASEIQTAESQAVTQAAGAENVAGSQGSRYPERAIQVIVPLGSGGDTDLCARLFSTYLEQELGVPVVVNNVKGAGGVTGSREVMNAAADGYTVLFYQYAALVNMMTGAADFSYIDDFELAGIAMKDDCYMWLGNAKDGYNDMGDVLQAARENPGQLSVALSGTGNMSQLSAVIMENKAGVDFNLIDFGSGSEQATALLSQQVTIYANYYVASKSYLESGDFKPLGIFAEERHPLFPDTPTMKELGYDVECLNTKFYYYAFPKGTPEEVVNAFSAAMEKVCANEEAKNKFYEDYYITLQYMDPAHTKEYMQNVFEEFNQYADAFK